MVFSEVLHGLAEVLEERMTPGNFFSEIEFNTQLRFIVGVYFVIVSWLGAIEVVGYDYYIVCACLVEVYVFFDPALGFYGLRSNCNKNTRFVLYVVFVYQSQPQRVQLVNLAIILHFSN